MSHSSEVFWQSLAEVPSELIQSITFPDGYVLQAESKQWSILCAETTIYVSLEMKASLLLQSNKNSSQAYSQNNF